MSVTHACGNTGLGGCVGTDHQEAPGGSQLVICAVS